MSEVFAQVSVPVEAMPYAPPVLPSMPMSFACVQAPSPTVDSTEHLDPRKPVDMADHYVKSRYMSADGLLRIAVMDDEFYLYTGSKYKVTQDIQLEQDVQRWLREQTYVHYVKGQKVTEPLLVNSNMVNEVITAMKRELAIERPELPAWRDEVQTDRPDPSRCIAMKNGILNVDAFLAREPASVYMIPPTPAFICTSALDFDFDPAAPSPTAWLAFLESVFPNDLDAPRLLRQWFGYSVMPDNSQQKIMLFRGPTRAGKGVTANILTALLGEKAMEPCSIAELSSPFGLWPLMNASMTILGDARVPKWGDTSALVEKLLNISGNDYVQVHRKFKSSVKMKLKTRILWISNEIPKLLDTSTALANRFVILFFKESFLGREDLGLEDRLMAELAGIFLWALEGLRDLDRLGHFTRPASSEESHTDLVELASPIRTFVGDCCEVGEGYSVSLDGLYLAWKQWWENQEGYPGTRKNLIHQLTTSYRSIHLTRPGNGPKRQREFTGIRVV